MWSIVALLLVGFALGWFFNRADLEVVMDLFTVLRECIRNSGHHAELPVQVAPELLEHTVSGAAAKTF